MALDEAIASSVRGGSTPPTLRMYGWDRPSVSLGCFQKVSDIDLRYCEEQGILIVRRPTGGRAILHGDEMTYSFSSGTDAAPFSEGLLASYKIISSAFHLALSKIGVSSEPQKSRTKGRVLSGSPLCFQSSSFGEILVNRSKLLGSAQKRWTDGLLQQGSLPYAVNHEETCRILADKDMPARGRMTALRDILPSFDELGLKNAIKAGFEETFGISLEPSRPSEDEIALALRLEETKYLRPEWNFRI